MSALPDSIGKYRVIRRLGEGGMGAVYLAHDDGIDRDVAIKLLRGHDEDLRRRFQTEAQSAGRLRHPNIVTIYEFGEFRGEPFLVMEFIEGETVASLVRSSLELSSRLNLLIQVCRGLAYAHRSSVVHRDIKPTNLMIDREGVAKIVDFGIARSGGRDLTMTGKVIGTPAYMAPEQIQGESADHRSDIFSIGLVIFEFLSGECAYSGDSDFAIINRIVNGSPNAFRHPSATVSPLLLPVIERAIAKDPAVRFQSADQLADELARVRSMIAARPSEHDGTDGPVTVLLPQSASKPPASKWTPALVGAAAVAMAVTIGALVWNRPVADQGVTIPPPPARVPASSPPIEAGGSKPAAPQPEEPQPLTPAIQEPVAKAPEPAARPKPEPSAPRSQTQANLAPALNSAKAALGSGDFEAAVSGFSQVLALDASNAQAIDGLSEAKRGLDRVRSAAVKARLAEAEQKLGDGAYDEAITIFDGILKTDASNPDALDGAARARRAKAAEDAVVKARGKKPSGSE